MTHVDVTVTNPQEPARSWAGRFLVDTGAFHTLVPRRHLEAIGITPDRQRTFEMADGTPVTLDIAIARLGPSRAGFYMYLVPVFSAAISVPFLGEALHAYHLIGAALIVGGVTVSSRRPKPDGPA